MIGRSILGLIVGGLVGLLAGPLVGFGYGLIEVVVITTLFPVNMTSAPGHPIMLAFLIAYTLFVFGGVIGGLTGLFTAAINRRFAGSLTAILIGIACGALLAEITSQTVSGFITYAIPSILTGLISANRVEETIKPRKHDARKL